MIASESSAGASDWCHTSASEATAKARLTPPGVDLVACAGQEVPDVPVFLTS